MNSKSVNEENGTVIDVVIEREFTMEKFIVKDGILYYRKWFKECQLDLREVKWAYLQQEAVEMKMCCGRAETSIGRVILVKKDGKKEIFQFEGMDEPKELLAKIEQSGVAIAIGYTKENREKFA